MRYAFISDIHSNLEALSAVLEEIDNRHTEEIICLGDITGYNANPNECVEIINSRGIKCIMGNHDARAAGLEEPDDFTRLAREAILWTRSQLKKESVHFLRKLPRRLYIQRDSILAIHGSLSSTDDYIFSLHDVVENFRLMTREPEVRLCFFGHTHVRIAFKEEEGKVCPVYDTSLSIEGDALHLVNPGSVGQPRDGDPRASFLICDTDASQIEFFRVSYDIERCREKIVTAGLPGELAQRLSEGW